MLFTNALRRRLRKDPSKVVHTLAVHPGYASTNLQHNRFPMWELLNSISAMPAADGALSQIYGNTPTVIGHEKIEIVLLLFALHLCFTSCFALHIFHFMDLVRLLDVQQW